MNVSKWRVPLVQDKREERDRRQGEVLAEVLRIVVGRALWRRKWWWYRPRITIILVNYYKGRLTESALCWIRPDDWLPNVTWPWTILTSTNPWPWPCRNREPERIHKLTKRIRTGGTTHGTTVTGGKEDDDDDDAMLVSPLEHKLDKILRATEKTLKPQPQRSLVPQTKRRLLPKTPKKQSVKQEETSTNKSGWVSSVKRGALKGLGSSLGVNVSRSSDTDSDDEGATRQKKKETNSQSGETVASGTGMGRLDGGTQAASASLARVWRHWRRRRRRGDVGHHVKAGQTVTPSLSDNGVMGSMWLSNKSWKLNKDSKCKQCAFNDNNNKSVNK